MNDEAIGMLRENQQSIGNVEKWVREEITENYKYKLDTFKHYTNFLIKIKEYLGNKDYGKDHRELLMGIKTFLLAEYIGYSGLKNIISFVDERAVSKKDKKNIIDGLDKQLKKIENS